MTMRAMILAAGLGTRLGELSQERPKPLLPVANVPVIRYPLALLRGHGIRDIIVNLHHLGDAIERELGDEVAYSRERELLGTGGGLRQAAPFFGTEPFLVMNGKIVVDVDLDAVVAHHRATGALATLVVRPDPQAAQWGAVDVDEEAGRVRALRGPHGAHMFTGIHVIDPALLARLPEGESDIVTTAYQPALAAGQRISAYTMKGYFWEHSTPARYFEGNLNVLRGQARLRHPPGPSSGVSPTARVAPTAVLHPPLLIGDQAEIGEGAIIGPDAIIGPRARIARDLHVTRAIVWPDVTVTTNLEDVIATNRGQATFS